MLKSVSSITNAVGALNFKGTWNASTNTPTLVSSVGVKGDYFVVGVAGSTTLNGISNWGVGDLATYNGSVWQRVEGGADLNGVNLSVSGTTTLSGLTASTALALDASKNVVSVTNTGTGDNVLATAPTLVGDVALSTGNLVIGTSGKGIDFSATPGTGTSELLNDYEEGTFTASFNIGGTANSTRTATYTKIGNIVYYSINFFASGYSKSGTGDLTVSGLPFVSKTSFTCLGQLGYFEGYNSTTNGVPYVELLSASQTLGLFRQGAGNYQTMTDALFSTSTLLIRISGTYLAN